MFFKNNFQATLVLSLTLHVGAFSTFQLFVQPAQRSIEQSIVSIPIMMTKEVSLSQPNFIPVPKKMLEVKEIPLNTQQFVPKILTQSAKGEIQGSLSVKKDPDVFIEKEISSTVQTQESNPETPGAKHEAQPLDFVNPSPKYPPLARRQGWEGIVTLEVHVEKDGTPSSITILKSSGHDLFDREALRTLGQWRFKPAQSGTILFASTITIPIQFRLIDEVAEE